MIDMQGGELEAQLRCEMRKQIEEHNRVNSATQAEDYALALAHDATE